MKHTITKELSFCYGHRLMNYRGKCQHLHGHNARVEVELQADVLDERGMVRDFGEVKAGIGTWLDRELDHRMILRADDPLLPLLKAEGEPLYAMAENPTAENLAQLIGEYGVAQGLPVSEVRFWETPTSWASFRFPAAP